MPRIVLPQVDRDPAHGDCMTCWVCRQKWPHAYDLVLDTHNRELRIDGGRPTRVRPAEANMLAVLVNTFPRWLTRTQIVEYAWAELPDVDMPKPGSVTVLMRRVKLILQGTRYTVQSDVNKGFRLVDDSTLEAERKYAEAQMPKVRVSADMAILSRGATKKTRTFKAPKPKRTKAPKTRKEKRAAKYERKTKEALDRGSNLFNRKRRQVEDV